MAHEKDGARDSHVRGVASVWFSHVPTYYAWTSFDLYIHDMGDASVSSSKPMFHALSRLNSLIGTATFSKG